MTTRARFFMPSRVGKTFLRPPCVIRLFQALGTAKEWLEDTMAVVFGLVLLAEVAAILAMLAGR